MALLSPLSTGMGSTCCYVMKSRKMSHRCFAQILVKSHPLTKNLPLLQSALASVLKGTSSPATHCFELIRKENCAKSLAEWNAAHQLLMLAVKDGTVDASADVEDNLYYWKDQLYCTVPEYQVTSIEDKNHIFKCLRAAHGVGLIESPEVYVQAIHIMDSVRKEVLVLKKAGIKLLERVLALEANLEDLRAAFQRYRERQLYSNLVGIAVQLIPIAGGAMAKIILAGAEIAEGLAAGEVVEYVLSFAAGLLEDENFSKLPPSRQTEVKTILHEYGYTTDDIRLLLHSCVNIGDSDAEIALGARATEDGRPAHCAQIQVAARDERESCNSESEGCEADNIEESGQPVHCKPSLTTNDGFSETWTRHILGCRNTEEAKRNGMAACLVEFLENEDITISALKARSSAELNTLKDAAILAVQQKLGIQMRIGQKLRLREFLDDFCKEGVVE